MSLDHLLAACHDVHSYQQWKFTVSHNKKNMDAIIPFDGSTIFQGVTLPFQHCMQVLPVAEAVPHLFAESSLNPPIYVFGTDCSSFREHHFSKLLYIII